MLPDKAKKLILKSIKEKLGKQKIGRPRKNLDCALEGVIFYIKNSCSLREIPKVYGSSSTIYYWIRRLAESNCFQSIWKKILRDLHKQKKLDLSHISIDCSITKAPGGGAKTAKNPFDKGKLATKKSIAVDAQGIPIALAIGTSCQHDSRLFRPTLEAIDPFIRRIYSTIHVDKAYDSKSVEVAIFNHYYLPNIARKKNRKLPMKVKLKKSYHRWKVERTFSWINRFRGTFVRWIRLEKVYLQMLYYVLAVITLRFL